MQHPKVLTSLMRSLCFRLSRIRCFKSLKIIFYFFFIFPVS